MYRKNRQRVWAGGMILAMLAGGCLTGCHSTKDTNPTNPTNNTIHSTNHANAQEDHTEAVSAPAGTQGRPDSDSNQDSTTAAQEVSSHLEQLQKEKETGPTMQTAVSLLQWGAQNTISPEQAGAAAQEWLSKLDSGAQLAFIDLLAQADETCAQLQSDQKDELLSGIGLDSSDITWPDTPLPVLEAIMEAAGLR